MAQSVLDTVVETAGRWTAARTTRRGFLGRLGRAAVLIAGGSGMAMVLSRADVASARVCGQQGSVGKCPAYDCSATWGWCWYASGCCADGSLKKLCDCCDVDTSNPRGYCPSGTRLLCIVESCGADPRLQTRPTRRLQTEDPTELSVAASMIRFPDGAPVVAIGDAESPLHAAVAATLRDVIGGPVLLAARTGPDDRVLGEIDRLGAVVAVIAAPAVPTSVDGALAATGLAVRRVGDSDDPAAFAAQVATWSRTLTGTRHAVVADGLALTSPGLAGATALALAHRWPLLLGVTGAAAALQEPRPTRAAYAVSDDPEAAEGLPSGRPVVGDSPASLAGAAATTSLGHGAVPAILGLAPDDDALVGVALAGLADLLLLYAPGSLEGAFEWILAHRGALDGAWAAGTEERFPVTAYHDLQSVVNEFEAHLLIGGPGDGLPIISQPPEERPVGQARR